MYGVIRKRYTRDEKKIIKKMLDNDIELFRNFFLSRKGNEVPHVPPREYKRMDSLLDVTRWFELLSMDRHRGNAMIRIGRERRRAASLSLSV